MMSTKLEIGDDLIVEQINSPLAETEKPVVKGADDALSFTMTHSSIEWTPEEERKLVRKLDRRILPLLFFSTLFSFLEGQVYGNAAILGMVQYLGLYDIVSLSPLAISLTKYSWTASIGFFAVLIFQYPALLAAQHLPLGKTTGFLLLYAGFMCFMMLVVQNFAGTIALRFFFGLGGVGTPLAIIITPMWYTAAEQPLRVSIWFSGSGFGTLVGQAVDYGISNIGGQYATQPWKWMYVILPSITVAFSFLYLYLFPDSPMKCRFLTEREKIIAVYRLEKNNTGIQARKFKRSHFLDCFKDPTTYVMCLTLFTFSFVNNALGSFAVFIVQAFGYTGIDVVLKLIPAAAVAFVCMLLSGIINGKFAGYRIVVCIAFMLPTMVGLIILWRVPRDAKYALFGGLYLFPLFYGSFSQVYGLLASNVAGHTKKTTINAFTFIFSAIGGIAGPFAFKGEEAIQGYPTGMITCLALLIATLTSYVGLFVYYRHFNAQQEIRMQEAIASTLVSQEEVAFLDLTEKENVFFRYEI